MAIKAATLLRKFAEKFEQTRGTFFDSGVIAPQACALGVLIYAVRGFCSSTGEQSKYAPEIAQNLPCLLRKAPACPGTWPSNFPNAKPYSCEHTGEPGAKPLPFCGMEAAPWNQKLGHLIAHLNDDHKWTFEQIYTWLETLPEEEACEVSKPAPCDDRKQNGGITCAEAGYSGELACAHCFKGDPGTYKCDGDCKAC